ncbi:MAG: arsenic resistance N-acetyltransferase ArsN2 [Gammaproteobacteria bacterium]
MHILPARSTDEPAIKRLLKAVDLPTEDITAKSLDYFLVLHDAEALTDVIGLDLEGDIALLRSLAVAESMRGRGVGNDMVQAAEALAVECAVREIYVLTTTADKYFAARGYKTLKRSAAPAALRRMPQFKTLCPSSSVLMVKIP